MAEILRRCAHCKRSHMTWWGTYVAPPSCKRTTSQVRAELFRNLITRITREPQ